MFNLLEHRPARKMKINTSSLSVRSILYVKLCHLSIFNCDILLLKLGYKRLTHNYLTFDRNLVQLYILLAPEFS